MLTTIASTLTDRYQTTVPEPVRRALHLGKRDKIHYTMRPTGEVILTRAETSTRFTCTHIADGLGLLAGHRVPTETDIKRIVGERLKQRAQIKSS